MTPIITSYRSSTAKIAKYLNHLLRPIVTDIIQTTTFIDEADLIRKLNHYTSVEHRLHPTTLFATIKISNFHTLFSHTSMLDLLDFFLFMNVTETRLQEVTKSTIKKLRNIIKYLSIFLAKDIIGRYWIKK